MKTSSCFFASWKLCISLICLNGNWAANLSNSPNHLISFFTYGVEAKVLILKTFFILSLFSLVIFLGALPAMSKSILVLFFLLLFTFYTSLHVKVLSAPAQWIHSFTLFIRNICSRAYGCRLRSVENNDWESNRLERKFQFHDLSYNV